jgi:hypothetical protein
MEGGLRRPYRPFQVIGVLAAVLSTALISLQFTTPDERAGARPIPEKDNLGSRGERLNANTIAIVSGNPNATDAAIASSARDRLFQEFVKWEGRQH